MIGDFRLMNDSQNKKRYVVNLSGEPPARGLWYGIEAFCSKDTREKLLLQWGTAILRLE